MTQVQFFDGGLLHDGVLVRAGDSIRLVEGSDASTDANDSALRDGIVTGRFTDHHVHLQLVDHTLLAGSRLGRVVDLGASPAWIQALSATASETTGQPAPEVAVAYAGAFLTAPGGYPSDRSWAPQGGVWEIADAEAAAAAVHRLADAGATIIKVVAHSEAGPVLSDECVRTVVATAATVGLPVVAHAEGAGQAQRVEALGVTRLAHTPFTELLDDAEIATQAEAVEWISTLAVHSAQASAIAIENLRRFAAAGGTVLYGTDMGNGDTPVDVRPSEIDALRAAGIDGTTLLTALAPASPLDNCHLLFLPAGDPSCARPLTPADLEA